MERIDNKSTFGNVVSWQTLGDPLFIFVHGLGGCKAQFEQAFLNAPLGYGVLAIDLPGFGESDRLPSDIEYSFANHASALSDILIQIKDVLRVKKMVLSLHSMASGLLPKLLEEIKLSFFGIVLIEGNLILGDAIWSKDLSEMDNTKFKRYFQYLKKYGHYDLMRSFKAYQNNTKLNYFANCYQLADERAFRETAFHTYQNADSRLVINALKNYIGFKLYLRGSLSSPWSGWPILDTAGINSRIIQNAAHFPHVDNPIETYATIYSIN
jgi:pimeloyl-ACP methyl ester carboxylesterase